MCRTSDLPDRASESQQTSQTLNSQIFTPSSTSLDRLKTFKFVKTSNTKGTGSPGEVEGSMCPPVKRRKGDSEVNMKSLHLCSSERGENIQGIKPNDASNSNSVAHPPKLRSSTDQSEGQGEFDLDDFMCDLEVDLPDDTRDRQITTNHEVGMPPSSPHPFRAPLQNPKVVTTTRTRTPKPLLSHPALLRMSSSNFSPLTQQPPPYTSTQVLLSQSTKTCTPSSTPAFSERTPSQPLEDTITTPTLPPASPFTTHPRAFSTTSACGRPNSVASLSGASATPKKTQTSSRDHLIVTPSTAGLRTPSFTQQATNQPARRRFPGPAGSLPALVRYNLYTTH